MSAHATGTPKKGYVITSLNGDFLVTVLASPAPDYQLPYFLAGCAPPCAGRAPGLDLALSILADWNGETLTEGEHWVYRNEHTRTERVFTYAGVRKLSCSWAWNLHQDFAEHFLHLVETLGAFGLTITGQQIGDWLAELEGAITETAPPVPPREPIRSCDCEHTTHFGEPHKRSGHRYGMVCGDVEPVKTPYGTFHICGECRRDHPPSPPETDKTEEVAHV